MNIKVDPNRIYQGRQVVLRVEPYADEAELYRFEWDYKDIPYEDVGIGENDGVRIIDTTRLQPGSYRVRVTALPRDAEGNRPEIARATFNVELRPVSGDQIDKILEKADQFLDRLGEPRTNDRAAAAMGVEDGGARIPPQKNVAVTLRPRFADEDGSDDNVSLWQMIRARTDALGFDNYSKFVDNAFCSPNNNGGLAAPRFNGVDAYKMLRYATEMFLLLNAGIFGNPIPGKSKTDSIPGESERVGIPVTYKQLETRLTEFFAITDGLPYLRRIVTALNEQNRANSGPDCLYIEENSLIFDEGYRHPLLMELIWSYWHEEGMLVQSINAVSLRFQNRLNGGAPDKLANFAPAPLYPVSNVLWGYVQEEYRRLSVNRRAHEYASQYGLKLEGKAVSDVQPAETRTKFIEAFHNLLYMTTMFYKQVDDTTFNADPFPLLNALREVHMILAYGAHNQFGDLPWTARTEMLTQQWIMARPEMNDFLRGRIMVPYEEPWMGAVDTMKQLQGWTDTSISQFHRLAHFGEQLLLSIRFTDWVGINTPAPARNWALYWRSEIQNYIHSYRAATGVDLTADAAMTQPAEMRYRMPSELLRERLSSNGRNGSRNLPQGQEAPQRLPAPSQRPANTQQNAPQLAQPKNGNSNGSDNTVHPTFRQRKALRK